MNKINFFFAVASSVSNYNRFCMRLPKNVIYLRPICENNLSLDYIHEIHLFLINNLIKIKLINY